MPTLIAQLPKYRLHKGTGQAVVTLDGKDGVVQSRVTILGAE